MAKMGKMAGLFIMVLLVSATIAIAARPGNNMIPEEKVMVVTGADAEGCDGEECLRRETLDAHTDFLYTCSDDYCNVPHGH